MRKNRSLLLWLFLGALLFVWSLGCSRSADEPSSLMLYVGTNTRQGSQGIYTFRFEPASGEFTELGLGAETENPTYLTIHPGRQYLYSVNELVEYEGEKTGLISAFSIDPATGALVFLNRVISRGGMPCYLSVDKTGRNLLFANYSGGSAGVCPIREDGRLEEPSAFVQYEGIGANPRLQAIPFAHSLDVSPDNRFAFAANLGLDKIFAYRFDPAEGSFEEHEPPFVQTSLGAGPRHLSFHPNGRAVYVVNEISSSLSRYAYDAAAGSFEELQTVSLLPEGYEGAHKSSEVVVHPSGDFLYATDRGPDTISVFSVDGDDGSLRLIERISSLGSMPWDATIDPTGSYLLVANRMSDRITVFRIDKGSGRLTPTGQNLSVSLPSCARFLDLSGAMDGS